jgi:predicted  nucleic acid-binding Zn-ribbon protein
MAIDPQLLETIHRLIDSRIEPIRVHREEHEELKAAVRRLEESMARVEDQIERLAAALRETQESLVRFQRSTEERLNALAEAQARTERRLEELAQAQARTEQRLEQLAQGQADLVQAQARTERRLEELAQAQIRTEEAVRELARGMLDLRRQVGGLSERVGSDLEGIRHIVAAAFLREQEGVELPALEGRYLRVDGEEVEFDLYGEGRRGGEAVVVLGECKARAPPRWRKGLGAESPARRRRLAAEQAVRRQHPGAAARKRGHGRRTPGEGEG